MSSKCVLCLDTLRDRYLHAHRKCLYGAIYFMRDGYESAWVSTRLVLRLAPVCYLCNENKSTDAEHVYPKSKGGDLGWPNIAGACSACNSRKHARVGISDEAEERWHQQQEVFRAAAARCVERGDLLYHDLIPTDGVFKKGAWRDDLAGELRSLIRMGRHRDGEEPAYDPEVLAEEAIDSWLETPAGQQFNLFDRDQR